MASLFSTMSLESLTVTDAVQLLSLPRTVGVDPADGVEITAQNGRYGPYVAKGTDSRSLATESALFTVTLDEALALFAAPKQYRGRGRAAPKPPLAEFGADPVSGKAIVAKEGKFGVYVTDGETNASIGRGDRIEEMTPERAQELLAARRESVASSGPKPAKKAAKKAASPAKRAATSAKSASAADLGVSRVVGKKSAAKKSPAKKAAAKKASSRRPD
jgi:DNA topoisomerase-1